MFLVKFLKQAVEITQEITLAFEQESIEEITFQSHKLKSSARAVGADALADICQDLEYSSRDNDQARVNALMIELNPVLEQVKEAIENIHIPA